MVRALYFHRGWGRELLNFSAGALPGLAFLIIEVEHCWREHQPSGSALLIASFSSSQ